MALFVLCSAKGSPGVTTTSLALALAWPRPVLLVEADPSGGDIMPGYIRGQLPCDRGLLNLAMAARHDRVAAEFSGQLVNLSPRSSAISRLLLPGLTSPAQAATVAPSWNLIAPYLANIGGPGSGTDVIVDFGQLAAIDAAWPVIGVADRVVLVTRTTLRAAAAAGPAIETLRRRTAPTADGPSRTQIGMLALEGGDYRPAEFGKRLGVPVVATMPWDVRDAAALSDGRGRSSAMIRAARSAVTALTAPTVAAPRPALVRSA